MVKKFCNPPTFTDFEKITRPFMQIYIPKFDNYQRFIFSEESPNYLISVAVNIL